MLTHLAISRSAGPIAGSVSHVEKLGGETLVYVTCDGQDLMTVRLFGEHDFSVAETVFVTPDLSRAFHFDASGARLR